MYVVNPGLLGIKEANEHLLTGGFVFRFAKR